MRLEILDRGHRTRVRLFFAMVSRLSGVPMTDVPKMLLYRPEFLGRSLLGLSADAMRGPSFWTAGEREHIGMRIAQWHECPYCVETHAEMVRIASTGEVDTESARPEVTAMLRFLERVSRAPDLLSASDLDPARQADVPDSAIRDALHVALVWNIVNRLANAFGFALREGQLHSGTRALHRLGYRFPGWLTGGRPPRDAVGALRSAVFDSPGRTSRELRAAAASGSQLPDPWQRYAATVRDQSYRVTDADIAELTAAGHSEEEIFEVTVAAAVGPALRSLDAGLRAASA